ncbi:MAG TPA: 6-carboxytetrahydropterin synthase [Ignavibacteria bacterium]
MLYVTRKEHFSASHRLHNPEFDKLGNEELFGKCNNFHGHNYYLEVTIAGKVDPKSGYVVDMKILKSIILNEIIERVDHKFLNEVDLFKDVIPTTENMALTFWDILNRKINFHNAKLFSIKLYETEKNFVELRID